MSTQFDKEFKTISYFDAPPSSEVIKKTIRTQPARVAEICFSPCDNAFVVLDEVDLDLINAEMQPYQDATAKLDALLAQQQTNHFDANLNKKVTNAQQDVKNKLKAIMAGGGASGLKWFELHRVHKANDIIWAPGKIFTADRKKHRRFFFLTDDNHDAENAFGSLRDKETGQLDANKVKEAFAKVSVAIKKEWPLMDKSGQVPTSVLASAASPLLAALLNDELEALDAWIAEVNKTLKWQRKEHQSEKQEAEKLLEHSADNPVTFEKFGRAQMLCRQIWKNESPLESIDFVDFDPSNDRNLPVYRGLLDQLKNKPLPPARWSASAEANLMRWKASAGASLSFDPTKMKMTAKADAKFDFALAEGKLAGAVYYPHDAGVHAKCSLPTKTNQQQWRIFDNAMAELTFFDVDSALITLDGIHDLAKAFSYWATLKKTVNDQYRLVVVGHTSLTGTNDYNKRLSAQRALMVYAFLTRNVDLWLGMFEHGIWGDNERDYLRKVMAQNMYGNHYESILPTIHWSQDLHQLIQDYFDLCESQYQIMVPGRIPELSPAEFAANYMIAKGELEPLIPTEAEEKANRRVEFVLLEAGEVKKVAGNAKADLGHFRFQFKGHIGAWAGINTSVSGSVEIDCSGGQMKFADRLGTEAPPKGSLAPKGEAKAQAEAFAGAKVEAGLAGSLDWKHPSEQKAKFKALGSVGYLVQGQAGIGVNADFAIGYSRELGRFVFKAKASLCIGLGAGGKFEFSVDAGQVWAFIRLVYDQLLNADFNVVDVFEAKVYDRFCIWSEALINNGLWFQGLALRGGLEVANQAVQLGAAITESTNNLAKQNALDANLHDLIRQIRQHPEELTYAPPEVKGRILYRLIEQDGSWRDLSFRGWQEAREEAIVVLLTKSVASKREYQEILEHMLAESPSGRSETQKCRDAAKAQQKLVLFMRDSEDRKRLMNWWATLPDPSNCACSVGNERMGPFY